MRAVGVIILWLVVGTTRAACASDVADAADVADPAPKASPPLAAAPIDIDGTWVLDLAASDDMDRLLEAQGVSYLERKVVDGLQVTQVITHQGNVITVDIHTVFKSAVQTLVVDGVVRTEPREDGGYYDVSHHWENGALVTVARGVNRQDAPFKTTTRRTLQDGGATLLQVTDLVRADGSVVTVRRVYRRSRDE